MFNPLLFRPLVLVTSVGLLSGAANHPLVAADQPQWGQAWTRNMVSAEKGLPATFDPKTGSNILWVARLGTEGHSTPIVAGGRIYIGTNNGEPRDPKHLGDRGVFMCFDEKTGRLIWQLVVPKRTEDPYFDWPRTGMSSFATVESDRVYLVNNRGEVMCLDALGFANGNDGPFKDEGAHMTAPSDSGAPPKPVAGAEIKPEPLRPPPTGSALTPGPLDADIIWIYDLVADAGIWPHDGAHSSILIHGDFLYLNTSTGVDNTHRRIRTPDAPSLVVIDKRTGRLVARDDEHIAPNIFHNTWSSPSFAEVNGRPLIFFAGGNGVLYAFETVKSSKSGDEVQKLKKVFQFDFDPTGAKDDVHRFTSNRRESPSNIYGMPVILNNRIYIAGGGDIWWGKNECWLKCIDATKTGDITKTAEIWSYPLEKHVLSTIALDQGLIYIADSGRKFHCVDAVTGKPVWTHDIKGEVWASPMVADSKVYLGTRSGDFYVFATGREKKVLMELALGTPMSATVTPANGVLYVATMKELFAIKQDAHWTH